MSLISKVSGKINSVLHPYVETEDKFISWLRFANAGMLHPGNIHCFDHAIKHLPSEAPILEIGSFCGLSTNVINHLMRKHKKQNVFFTCDKWEFEKEVSEEVLPGSELKFSDYRTFVKESYMRNVRLFSSYNIPHTIEVFADDFFEMRLWP
jgi:hypothetical protein